MIKNTKTGFIVILVWVSLILTSCHKCEELYGAVGGVGLRLKTVGGADILNIPPYNLDSLQLLDELHNKLPVNYTYSTLHIGSVYTSNDQKAFDTEVCKVYYLRFLYNNVDTVKICYKVVIDNDCNVAEFSYLKGDFNGKRIFEEYDHPFNGFTIIK